MRGDHARGGGRSGRRAVAILAGALLVLATAATAALAQQTHDVEVVDDAFEPPSLEVTEGDTVRWTQTGSNPHTVTSDDDDFDSHPACQTFADAADGDCMDEGDTYEHTFEEAGEYGYHCRIHGSPGAGMAGTIVVAAADDDPVDDNDDAVEEEDEPVDEETDEVDELPRTGALAVVPALVLIALGGALLARRARTT